MPQSFTEWALTVFILAASLFAVAVYLVCVVSAFSIALPLGVFMLAVGAVLTWCAIDAWERV